MGSAANERNSLILCPEESALRILSASTTLRYSFFCCAAETLAPAREAMASNKLHAIVVARIFVSLFLFGLVWVLPRLARKEPINQFLLNAGKFLADVLEGRALVVRQHKDGLIELPQALAQVDLELLEARRLALSVHPGALQSGLGGLDLVAIVSQDAQRLDIVGCVHLPAQLVELRVAEFRQNLGVADGIGFPVELRLQRGDAGLRARRREQDGGECRSNTHAPRRETGPGHPTSFSAGAPASAGGRAAAPEFRGLRCGPGQGPETFRTQPRLPPSSLVYRSRWRGQTRNLRWAFRAGPAGRARRARPDISRPGSTLSAGRAAHR